MHHKRRLLVATIDELLCGILLDIEWSLIRIEGNICMYLKSDNALCMKYVILIGNFNS